MTLDYFEKVNAIVKSMDELKRMRRYLENSESVYVLGNGYHASDAVRIPPGMRAKFLDICVENIKKLEEEFERL